LSITEISFIAFELLQNSARLTFVNVARGKRVLSATFNGQGELQGDVENFLEAKPKQHQ
jgi:hypothetical protein